MTSTPRLIIVTLLVVFVGFGWRDSLAQDPSGVIAKHTQQETFAFGRFGTVHVYVPTKIQSVAIFAAGDGGWNDGTNDMAQLLANEGALIAGIDTPHYLSEVGASDEQCAYPAGELEALAHALEKRYGLPTYLLPTLVGYSSGATLVYAAAAQAPKGTFGGLLTLGFCSTLATPKELCRGRALASQRGKVDLDLEPNGDLGLPWTALHGQLDEACSLAAAQTFIAKVGNVNLVPLPKVGHGYAIGRYWQSQYVHAYHELGRPVAVTKLAADIRDLPLIEVPSTQKSDRFAVLVTGDGGWAGLDREVAAGLARAGIPVVALSSLQYFWNPRTPQAAAHDLARVIDHYSTVWGRERVVLVGYSFGADALPAMVNLLPASELARVNQLALIGLSPKASFEIHVAGWLGPTGDVPVLPELRKLSSQKLGVLCIRGEEEHDSLCSQLPDSLVTNVVLKGGHHFGGDYSAVVRAILEYPSEAREKSARDVGR